MRIVGRAVEPDQDGEVLSVGLDSLAAKDSVPPEFYALALQARRRPGRGARPGCWPQSGEGLDVQAVVNPADRLAIIRVVIVALIAVLALIGLANLLTASALGLRDHAFDLAVLKAMGLTPRQVMATLVTGTGLLVVLGVAAGAAAGASVVTGLIDLQGHTSGVGRGHRPPALRAVTLSDRRAGRRGRGPRRCALIPARRAARAQVPVTGTLSRPRPGGRLAERGRSPVILLEREPVEAVARQREQVGQRAHAGKCTPPRASTGVMPSKRRRSSSTGCGILRQVVDAQHHVVALLADVGEHRRVARTTSRCRRRCRRPGGCGGSASILPGEVEQRRPRCAAAPPR